MSLCATARDSTPTMLWRRKHQLRAISDHRKASDEFLFLERPAFRRRTLAHRSSGVASPGGVRPREVRSAVSRVSIDATPRACHSSRTSTRWRRFRPSRSPAENGIELADRSFAPLVPGPLTRSRSIRALRRTAKLEELVLARLFEGADRARKPRHVEESRSLVASWCDVAHRLGPASLVTLVGLVGSSQVLVSSGALACYCADAQPSTG